jgi:molybdopterin adenylyltransferase
MRVGILTISDRGAKGDREDESGKLIKDMVSQIRGKVERYEIVPDDEEQIAARLKTWSDEDDLDLILTTGGTGFSPRDTTPEATLTVIERLAPGIPEAMRAEGMKKTPRAMLSRAVAGIRRKTLIINLPGSVKGVKESLSAILPALPHGIEIIRGQTGECGSET